MQIKNEVVKADVRMVVIDYVVVMVMADFILLSKYIKELKKFYTKVFWGI